MPEAFYDKYPEMLPKKLNSESIDTYDQMMEIFAPNSRLLPQDFHRI
jgi:hypothetical protein